jgi:hypothetical protein
LHGGVPDEKIAGMERKVRVTLAFTVLRWLVMLGLLGYGIFSGKAWAIAAGILVAAAGLIYSTTALAGRGRKRPPISN